MLLSIIKYTETDVKSNTEQSSARATTPCKSSLAHSTHENLQYQQASWRSTNSCLTQSIDFAARVPSHQECGVAPTSCFRHHGFSPGVHPADCDVTRFSATQQAPELFRISLRVFSLGDWRACLLCHDSADRWTTTFTCLLLLASRPRPCLTKSYTCFANDVSVGFCYLSVSIRLPGGPDS